MANLSVIKLDNEVYQLLRISAANHGVSMEEEVRQLIYQAIKAPDKLSTSFRKYFRNNHGIELQIPSRKLPHNPLDLGER